MEEIKTKHRIFMGKQLQAKREEQGWSVEQVAEMAEVKPVTIEKIEAGVFNVALDVLVKVANVLGCDIILKERRAAV